MSNFITAFKKGQRGENKGLNMGIPGLNRATNGINRKRIYTIASAPKVGKSTFCDFSFVLSPYLEWLKLTEENGGEEPHPLQWIYYSFEVDRVQKEFKFAAFFMAHDHGIERFDHKGETWDMDSEYLQGRKRDRDDEIILVCDSHKDKLKEIYEKRIIPLFGEYDDNGRQIRPGLIIFIEQKNNPTGIRNDIIKFMLKHGVHITEPYSVVENGQEVIKTKVIGYKPNNPKAMFIIILDHIRKPSRERGFSLKDNIDKMSEYMVEMRNMYELTFVPICHSNRNLADPNRKREAGEWLFITADDIKDSGNLSEDSDYVFTMFNPNDEKFNLDRHFGVQLKDPNGGKIHPDYRSIHLVESRHTKCPVHVQIEMYGGINTFKPLIINLYNSF